MKRQQKSLRAGFTLVELLVALGLTIFLLALFTSLMVAATGSINTSQGIGAVDQQVRNAVTTIRDDLQNVYVANGGTRLSLSRLFITPSAIPTQGYFMLEENDRAIRQGLDAAGIPVEVDFDDVLAFTVGRPAATKREEFYYGRVYNANGATLTNNPTVDLGNYLDNTINAPFNRFDTPGNNLFSSRYAEVVYFLRANGRHYSVQDIRGNISGAASPTVPATPPTFTLYRRQLLVVENAGQLNRGSTAVPFGIPLDDIPNATAGVSPYSLFDLSMSREYQIDNANNLVRWVFPTGGGGGGDVPVLHFNTLDDLSKREFRYGMNRIPFTTGTEWFVRGVPQSHNIYAGYAPVHCYNIVNPASPTQDDTIASPWFGRPTQAENNAVTSTNFWPVNSNGPIALPITDANNDAIIDPATPLTNGGDDVLLTNVISFDVKVFEENELSPNFTVPFAYLDSAAPGLNPLDNVVIKARTRLPLLSDTAIVTAGNEAQVNSRLRRPEFVDLGYGYDATNFLGSVPANDTNVLTLTDYYYNPVLSRFGLPFNPAYDPQNQLMNIGQSGAAYTGTGAFVNGVDGLTGTPETLLDDFVTIYTNTQLDKLKSLQATALGASNAPGRSGVDDNGDNVVDDINEYMAPYSDDMSIYLAAPYAKSGQVGENLALIPWRLTDPRNTYDTWCADATTYDPNPKLLSAPFPRNPNFRPVPYPRPLKGIQIKLRVLEPKTGIVRDFTLRHYFD